MTNMTFTGCISNYPVLQLSNCSSGQGEVGMANSIFHSNVNENGAAGIQLSSGCRLSLQNVSFVGNKGKLGTGLVLEPGSHMVAMDSVFKDNIAQVNGGVLAAQSSSASLIRCELMNNTAGNSGGAVFTEVSGTTPWLQPPIANMFSYV